MAAIFAAILATPVKRNPDTPLISQIHRAMKLFLFTSLLTGYIHCTTVTVYVCDSKNATKYHYKENCRGLSNCKHQILSMDIEKAKKSGKSLCGWEK